VKKIIITALALFLMAGTQAMGQDLSFTQGIGQSSFQTLSRQAGAALSYKNTAPAAPLGLTGFDAGVEVTAVDIKKNSDYWSAAFGGDAPDFLLIPKLRVRKGLFWGLDVGGMYAYVPDSNVKLYGFELSKALLEGSVATPALGIRGSYTRLAGVDDLDLQTAGIDATISKGFLILTPYAGAGAVYINSKPKGKLQSFSTSLQGGVPLKTEELWQPRYFAGLKVTPLPLLGVTAEVEYQERMIYSLKAAINF
jgi:hypothetical protein